MNSSKSIPLKATVRSTRTATATRHRIGTSTEQQTLQAIAVIQNTIECGIAHICHSRKLFPDSCFRFLNVKDDRGGVCGTAVVFGLEHSQDADETHFADECSAANDGKDHRSYHDFVEANNSIDNKSENTQNLETSTSISPLTSDFDELNAKESGVCYNANQNSNRFFRQDQRDMPCDYEKEHSIMKAEIRLLIHWIHGLNDILVDDRQRTLLKRVVFGICKNGDVNRSLKESNEKKQEDDLVESFTFNLSNAVKKGDCIDHGCIQNQFQMLFRNLQSFNTHTHASSLFKNKNDDVLCTDLSNPRSRYLTFRVEFFDPCIIPRALDPTDVVNRHAAHTAVERDTNSNEYSSMICEKMKNMIETPLGQVVEKNCTGLGVKLIAHNVDEDFSENIDDVPTSSFYTYTGSIKRDCESAIMSHAGPFSKKRQKKTLAKASDSNVATSASNCSYKSRQRIERLEIESSKTSTNSTSPALTTSPSSDSRSQEIILKNGTNAFAIPFTKTKGSQTRAKVWNKYIPCEILEHRVKNESLQYKVCFDNELLDQAKMKRQWLNSLKVASMDAVKAEIQEELESITKCDYYIAANGRMNWENVVKDLMNSKALERNSVELLLNDILELDHNSGCSGSICNEFVNAGTLHTDQCSIGAGTCNASVRSQKKSKFQCSYTYAMNSITITVPDSF